MKINEDLLPYTLSLSQPTTNKKRFWIKHSNNIFDASRYGYYQLLGYCSSTSLKVVSDSNALSVVNVVEPGKTYTFSRKYNNIPGWMNSILGFEKYPALADEGVLLGINSNFGPITFTVPEGIHYIVFSIRYPNSAGAASVCAEAIQLEENTAVTAFSSYDNDKLCILENNSYTNLDFNRKIEYYTDTLEHNSTIASWACCYYKKIGHFVSCDFKMTSVGGTDKNYFLVADGMDFPPVEEVFAYCWTLDYQDKLKNIPTLIQFKPNGKIYIKYTGTQVSGDKVQVHIDYMCQ